MFFLSLVKRNAAFLALPTPLCGKSLYNAVRELVGLHTCAETVRVDVGTLKEECKLALSRNQINTQSEIGRQCDRVQVQKKKRKECSSVAWNLGKK